VLLQFIDTAARILEDHPVNRGRRNAGRSPANAVWLWGQGRAPAMPTLEDLHGLRGAMISAVDLLKGLGIYAGLQPVAVPGATGYLDTNYAGKVAAALDALEQGNFVYLHVEAPDEAAHEGSLSKKVAAIEAFDAHVVGPLVAGLQRFPAVRLLAATDHLTPLARRTHVADPVPFVLLEDLHRDLAGAPRRPAVFDEPSAAAAGWAVDDGVALFRALVTTP
jgi:2,3-bisphosphoglycerate-independent phosphoglycerate mutase